MNENKEINSEWDSVVDYMKSNKKELSFGKYLSYWFHHSPRRMLHYLSYYKFAAKLIGCNKKVLDVGCSEGLGTWLVAKECGYAKGIDFDVEAIETAKRNFCQCENIYFGIEDIFNYSDETKWDAIINFDVIEHIIPENSNAYLSKLQSLISSEGIVILGTPSKISQQFASKVSKKGHINIYDHATFKTQLEQYFHHVFIFAANDEVVHTGFLPLANYYIAVCCKKKIK
jgi:2-polyprenyl-3-methyl-5-hydroxy-6-metoxy-1,4-benzoquinol methylase